MAKVKENNVEPTKKKKRTGLKIFLFILILLIIGGCVFAYKVTRNGGGVQGIIATTLGHDEQTLKNLPQINFVAMGKSEGLTDTIILCAYDPKTQKASMLSIPRDTYTGVNKNYATYNDKINAKYSISPEKTVEAVSELTGVEVTNYVVIDTKALKELVDTIGGVYFDVPIRMKYDDYSQKLHIDLQKGYQLLDGNKAEQVVRFRHNNDGSTYPFEYGMEDLGRMRTQREFIMATIQQTVKPQNIFKINEFLEIVEENVETNMDFSVLKDYIPYAVNFSMDNLRTETLPGEPGYGNNVALFFADEDETEELVQEMFLELNVVEDEETKATEKSEINIEILNASGKNSNLSELIEKLENEEYNVVKTGTTELSQKTTIINRTEKNEKTIEELKEIVSIGEITIGEDDSNVDFTIIIGKDYE